LIHKEITTMTTRRPFSFLSATLCGLALGASVLLAGCGGGGSSSSGNNNGGGGSGASLAAGRYQGTYLNTSGQYSPASGTLAFTVSSTGAVTATIFNDDGSTGNDTGTIGSDGKFSVRDTDAGGDGIDGTRSQDSTTHVFSMSYTETNGTKGVLKVGLAPTSSAFAGSYSGTFSSSTGGGQGTFTLTITAGGVVTGTAVQAGVSTNLSGYVDSSGNIYLAETSLGVPITSFGGITLVGTSLSGTLQGTGADGSSNTITVSGTKQ